MKKDKEDIVKCGTKRLPYVMKKEELLKLLRNIDDIRESMMIFMGIFQGLRIRERLWLKWEDVDLEHGEIRILDSKNPKRYKSGYGRDRVIPINDMFLHIYKKWRAMNPDEEYVIPFSMRFDRKDPRGKKKMVKHFQDKLQKYLTKTGMLEVDYLQKDGKPRYKYHDHTFRHVCGTNLYRAGMDIFKIKEFLGHEQIETTQLYCKLAKDDLKEASHCAYAYPKQRVTDYKTGLMPQIEVSLNKDTLELQKDILDKQLRLKQLQMMEVSIHANTQQ
jgi:integrase